MCGHIKKERQAPRVRKGIIQNGYEWLQQRKVKAFYVMVDNCSFNEGAQALIQATGIGKLAPNILLMGYKENWQTCPREEVQEYFTVLHEALDNYMAIALLRVRDGFDCAHLATTPMDERLGGGAIHKTNSTSSIGYGNNEEVDFDPNLIAELTSPQGIEAGSRSKFGNSRSDLAEDSTGIIRGSESEGSDNPTIADNLSFFMDKQEQGNIDVWWLYDDGGLTLLLPYIVSARKNWASCKLRVFALSNKKDQMEQELRG